MKNDIKMYLYRQLTFIDDCAGKERTDDCLQQLKKQDIMISDK